MDETRSIQIRAVARSNLLACKERCFREGFLINDFLVRAPERLAVDVLGLRVHQVPEIPDDSVLQGRRPGVAIAGKLDRKKRLILVAQKFGFERGRFTLAHEIAHFLLHEGMLLHREIVLNSGAAANNNLEEREANLFGAELLMPSKLVRDEFLKRFIGTIDGRRMRDQIHYWLSLGNGELDPAALIADDPTYRAAQFAKTRSYFGRRIISLCELFQVSAQAMAIQLIDLSLVK